MTKKRLGVYVSLCVLAVLSMNCTQAKASIDRVMAYNDTMLCVNETAFQPGLTTYPVHSWLRMPILGKSQISLIRDGKTYRLDKAADASLDIQTWGFTINGTVDNVTMQVDCSPVIFGRDNKQREGVAVIKVKASGLKKTDEILFEYGGLRRGSWVIPHERIDLLSNDGFPGTENDTCTKKGDMVLLNSDDVPVTVALTADTKKGKLTIGKHPEDNRCRISWQPDTGKDRCTIVIAFAQNADSLKNIIAIDPAAEFKKTKKYFSDVINTSVIDTPSDSMDKAFMWAVLCMEYCYYEKTGWIESLDHWITQYSMMYPRAAEDMGQFERSKNCLIAHAEATADNGRIRNIDPSGLIRDDFYWNHHFVWNVEHYLDYTGDIDTVRQLYPATKKAVQHSFNTYDRDKNLLIGWDQQIGYQEDFVLSPNDAGSASMAGVEMLRILAKLAKSLGHTEDAELYASREKIARERLESELWSPQLGRFIYYRDRYGKKHLDGQYHTFSWPAIYGFSNIMGRYSSLRHMTDTLLSPRGLVYVSKNFPGHMAQTTGCQEAAVQTPIAAWGLCAGGMREEGAKMFEAFGDLVMSETNKGCYPETAEMPGTWFSPTASFYIEAVVEGLFGIKWTDGQKLLIKPGIPDSWDTASIKMANYTVEFRQTPRTRKMDISLKSPTSARLSWLLPLAKDYTVRLDGRRVEAEYTADIKGVRMTLDLPNMKKHIVEIKFDPVDVQLDYPGNLKAGELFKCNVNNALIKGVKDPASLLASTSVSAPGLLDATLRYGLMDDFVGYGRLGQETFSRRTFFLDLQAGKHNALWPVDFTVDSTVTISRQDTSKSDISVPVEIPLTHPATDWQRSRWLDSLPALGLFAITDPLKELEKKAKPIDGSDKLLFSMENNGGDFAIQPGRMTILSDHFSHPSITFKVDKKATALKFLLLPLVNNIDVFSQVAEITVRAKPIEKGNAVGHVDTDLYHKVLHYPGDLDNWFPAARSHGYHSYGRRWTDTPAISTELSTFNVVTMDFGKEIDIDTVTVRTVGRHPAIGIVAVSAEVLHKD